MHAWQLDHYSLFCDQRKCIPSNCLNELAHDVLCKKWTMNMSLKQLVWEYNSSDNYQTWQNEGFAAGQNLKSTLFLHTLAIFFFILPYGVNHQLECHGWSHCSVTPCIMFHKVCLIFQKSYSEVAVIRSGGEKIKLKPSPWSSARHRAVEVSQPAATENRGEASWAFIHILAPWLIHAAKHQKECFEFQGSSTIASKCQNAINHTCARKEEEETVHVLTRSAAGQLEVTTHTLLRHTTWCNR